MPEQKTILAIDDDTDILETLKIVLDAEGFTVATASSGAEGIAAAGTCKPDIILCDMMMESIDAGVQTARQLKEKLPATPIFLLSSIAEATAATAEMRELGFSGILQKPVDPQHVISTIKNVLG